MKLIAFIMLTTILHVCTPGMSQRVTISCKNLQLEGVFKEITNQTGYDFFYQSDLIKAAAPVTLNVKDMHLEDVLNICLQGQGLGFKIRSHTIVIFQLEKPAESVRDSVVTIKGKVVDASGRPVEMASIILLRTKAGTQTDKSGFFILNIKNPRVSDVLNISFVSLKNTEVPLTGKTNLGQIVLEAKENVLDETKVIAYGATSERFRIGDISVVKAADIEKTPALNVLEALAGRVPGLYVRQNGSNPSSVFNLNLRGFNIISPTLSMAMGDAAIILSKPLIVIDGLPLAPDVVNEVGQNIGVDAITGLHGASDGQDPLYWLNTFDVESMTVLKDAEATALYGSRAANGVIMITTKKGKPGKTSLNISANTGINTQARRIKLMNTQQYLTMRHEAWNNTLRAGLPLIGLFGISYVPTPANSYDMLVWDTTHYTDWQEALMSSAPVYNLNVELSGGEERAGYRIAGGYNRWNSSYPHMQGNPGFKEEKGNLSISLSTRSTESRFRLTASIINSITSSLQPVVNPDPYILLAPDAPANYDATGKLNFADWRPASPSPSVYSGNPLFILACPYRSNRFTVMTRTNLSYTFFSSLIFNMGIGYARSAGKQSLAMPAAASDPLITTYKRLANFGNSTSTGFNIEPTLHYVTKWTQHHLDMLAGGSFQSDKQDGNIIIASGYTSDQLMTAPQGAASVSTFVNVLQRKSISALARISYNYAEEFLVELSGRRDGSSSFGPGTRYGNFGSIGLGWVFTRESWFKKIPFLSFGKIRGSYGTSGSESSNPYAYLSTFRPPRPTSVRLPSLVGGYITDGFYQGIPTLSLTRVANPSLGWAQAQSLDLGIDLYFLADQRLKLSTQWYRKRTGNQLVTNAVSSVTGTTTYIVNIPAKVENTGFEVIIDYTSHQPRSKLGGYININVASNRNKLLAYPGLENSPLKNYYEIGQPLVWKQLYPTFLDKTKGIYAISDSSHPNPAPYKVSNCPQVTGGIQGGISWKGFSVTLSWTFARQKGFLNIQGAAQPGSLDYFGMSNQSVSVLQSRHWQNPTDSTLGGALYAASVGYTSNLDVYWGDASYIALKNATLSYDLPRAFLDKARIRGLSIYTKAENLVLFSSSGYKGANPEQPGLSQQFPLRMVLVCGLNINL